MDDEQIIVVEGVNLKHLLNNLNDVRGLRKLAIHVEGDKVKFKINEHSWSPPMGMNLAQWKKKEYT